MKNISRRTLIRTSLTGVSAAFVSQFLGGCTPQATPAPTATVAPTAVPATATAKPAEATHPPAATAPAAATEAPKTTPTISFTPTPATPPEMVVARGSDPEKLVRQALKAMGGMEAFVKKGAKVIIKPNICVAYGTFENAYTTNPWVVGTLVKMCFEAGAASVRVMDAPFNGTAANAYVRSGISEKVKAAGGEMVEMAGYKFVPNQLAKAKDLKNIGIYDEIMKADAIINVPIAKDHSLTRLTLGMKNLMGVIDDRMAIHINFAQRLPDLATQIRPVLNVIDAIRILKANGPASGTTADVKKLDTLIVTPDIVAGDAFAATLFDLKPQDLKYVVTAAEMKLGKMDLSAIKTQEIKVDA